jgi:hypothetical protein
MQSQLVKIFVQIRILVLVSSLQFVVAMSEDLENARRREELERLERERERRLELERQRAEVLRMREMLVNMAGQPPQQQQGAMNATLDLVRAAEERARRDAEEMARRRMQEEVRRRREEEERLRREREERAKMLEIAARSTQPPTQTETDPDATSELMRQAAAEAEAVRKEAELREVVLRKKMELEELKRREMEAEDLADQMEKEADQRAKEEELQRALHDDAAKASTSPVPVADFQPGED